MNNREFAKKIKSYKSKFYLFDFHVHSPASYDVRLGDRFEDLSIEEKKLLESIDESITNDAKKYEDEVIESFAPEIYYSKLVQYKNKLTNEEHIEEGEDWAFIAITDHNVCSYADKLSNISFKKENLKKNRLIILPGIELEIRFTEPNTGEKVSIHTLLIFKGKTSVYNISNIISRLSNENWQYGTPLNIENLPDFIIKMRCDESFPAICIAAHVTSSKGINAETKKCILDNDIDILRCKEEIGQAKDKKSKEEFENELKLLVDKKKKSEEISFEILDLIGKCGFDALQVRDKDDEKYYYNIHRHKEELGRSIAIACSDSHKIEGIFKCNSRDISTKIMPFIKLNSICTSSTEENIFMEIRDKGLRYGETRITFRKPKSVSYWIEGIQITKESENSSEFWVNENTVNYTTDSTFYLSFSRNLNCLIGGRGSGKSAAIEILEFMQNHNEFVSQGKIRNEKVDWYERAKSTLKGYKISILWKILNKKSLKKSSLFVEGFFDEKGRYPALIYTDIDGKSLLASSIELPKVDFYRIHDIEEKAKPERLRELFDRICGENIETISNDINNLHNKLEQNRIQLVEIANKIDSLTVENSPLREYVRRKHDFNLVNKDNIKKEFESLDKVTYANDINNNLLENWDKLINNFKLEDRKNEIYKIIDNIKQKIFNNEEGKNKILDYCQKIELFMNSISYDVKSDDEKTKSTIYSLIESLEVKLSEKKEILTENEESFMNKINSLNESLRLQGIDGAQNRQTKKMAYDESIKSLDEYRQYKRDFVKKYKERELILDKYLEKYDMRSKLRKSTADNITLMLKKSLNEKVIDIEVDAQERKDIRKFYEWISSEFEWNKSKYKEKKIQALLDEKKLTPDKLKKILMNTKEDVSNMLLTDKESASSGKIELKESKSLIEFNKAWIKLEPEKIEEMPNELPEEIKDGIITLNHKLNNPKKLNLDSILMLDEVQFDDLPVIRLNDRPKDQSSKKKELDKLSPGQRCSAILPIILLTGNCPIVIDQPEDNLDNRLIRQVIVNVLANIKLKRQVIIATHNANLPVLGDAEKVIALRGVDEDKCCIEAQGSLDDEEVVRNITEIMEGGREAFQYRQSIYQSYWDSGVDRLD